MPVTKYIIKIRATGELIGNPTTDPAEARYYVHHALAFNSKLKETDLQILTETIPEKKQSSG